MLLYDLHHIAFEVWSIGVLHKELAADYCARVRGTAVDLPALPIQYADYAAWQRERISGALLENNSGTGGGSSTVSNRWTSRRITHGRRARRTAVGDGRLSFPPS
ncbi:MAG TPA: condensation domain-containing protein [Micromonosporaceae bacterium]